MVTKKKFSNAMLDCYIKLYEKSTPYADFKYLMDTAKIDSLGRRIINFNDYEIKDIVFEKILNIIIKKYKFNKSESSDFKIAIYLGCSPKTVTETINEKRRNKIINIKNKIKNQYNK